MSIQKEKWIFFLFIILSCIASAYGAQPRITLSMIMRNEAAHYLREMLEDASHYIDEAVIIDDNSTDESVALCHEVLRGIPHRIIKNARSTFANEVVLRKQQWAETIKTDPEWILCLDADQIFESKFKTAIKQLLASIKEDVVLFRLYDFWDKDHYREDKCWFAHNTFRPFLVRYKPEVEYQWRETAQHCGHFPLTISQFSMIRSELRLKHYGWAKPEDRQAKYLRYQQLDPECRFGWREQNESILDENPHLVAWTPDDKMD